MYNDLKDLNKYIPAKCNRFYNSFRQSQIRLKRCETYTTNAQRDREQNKKRKKIKSIMISKKNILP